MRWMNSRILLYLPNYHFSWPNGIFHPPSFFSEIAGAPISIPKSYLFVGRVGSLPSATLHLQIIISIFHTKNSQCIVCSWPTCTPKQTTIKVGKYTIQWNKFFWDINFSQLNLFASPHPTRLMTSPVRKRTIDQHVIQQGNGRKPLTACGWIHRIPWWHETWHVGHVGHVGLDLRRKWTVGETWWIY